MTTPCKRDGKLLFAYPGLRAANQREAQIPAHREFPAAIFEGHFASVYPAGVGVQNVASRILLTALFHIAQEHHTNDGLIFAIVLAFGAHFLSFFGIETGLDLSENCAVFLEETNQSASFVRSVVDGAPQAGWRRTLRQQWRYEQQGNTKVMYAQDSFTSPPVRIYPFETRRVWRTTELSHVPVRFLITTFGSGRDMA